MIKVVLSKDNKFLGYFISLCPEVVTTQNNQQVIVTVCYFHNKEGILLKAFPQNILIFNQADLILKEKSKKKSKLLKLVKDNDTEKN